MGNRAHWALIEKFPWLRRKPRGFHADGPQPWIKRVWARKLRGKMRELLRGDHDDTSYPRRMGDRWNWY